MKRINRHRRGRAPGEYLGFLVIGFILTIIILITSFVLWISWPINPLNLHWRLEKLEQQAEPAPQEK